MNLTPIELYHLFTHFPEYEYVSPLSVHPSDNPIHRVRVIPTDIAERLRVDDPHEEIFHIEYFPTLNRAELWSAQSWKESLSRILKLKAAAREADPTTPLIEELAYLEEEVKIYLIRTLKLPGRNAVAGAHAIICSDLTPEQKSFIDLLNLPSNLTSRIDNAKQRLAELRTPDRLNADVERGDSTGEEPHVQDQTGI